MQPKLFKFENTEDSITLDVKATEVKEDNRFNKKGDIILRAEMHGDENHAYYALNETIEIGDFPKGRELTPGNVLDWVVPYFADQYERVADHRDTFVPLPRHRLLAIARELFDEAEALVKAADCKLAYDDAEGSGVVHAIPEDAMKSMDGTPFAETIANGPEMLYLSNTYCEPGEGTEGVPDWWDGTVAETNKLIKESL